MPSTYVSLATTTLSSTAASITFSSISSAYTDLRVVLVAHTDAAGAEDNAYMRFNSDSATNYSNVWIQGSGSSATSSRTSNSTAIWSRWSEYGTATSNIWTTTTFDIFDYRSTSVYKSVLATGSAEANGAGWVTRSAGTWRSYSAITSITLPAQGGSANFAIGTTATLYGILRA
jgi:hypothetical protein